MRCQLRTLRPVCLRVALLCAAASAHAAAPPPTPFNLPQIPGLPGADAIRQKVTEAAISRVLDNELPVRLDATSIYPTVAAPPGGPFHPQPLALSPEDLNRPLPPGDYTLPMLAFCMEYSVHRPGAGTAYVLGPLQGKAAQAIGALLWRGAVALHMPPQQLQSVSWAIQSGLTYSQMPPSFQAVIDRVIPDYKSQLNGNFLQQVQNTYQTAAHGTGLPPLEKLLGGMGQPGQMALSSMKQQQILLRQNTSDQLREQTLFRGQESGVYTPVKAEEGPWTERIRGVAYVRFKIVGGNLASNNVLEVRILPTPGSRTAHTAVAGGFMRVAYGSQLIQDLVRAQQQGPGLVQATVDWLVAGVCGYAVSRGAQVLCPTPAAAQYPQCKCPNPNFSSGVPLNNGQQGPTNALTPVTNPGPGQSKWSGWELHTPNVDVYTDYCLGKTVDGIMFLPKSCPDMHIRQFVMSECPGKNCGAASYISSCNEERFFGTIYLDQCANSDHPERNFLTPDSSVIKGWNGPPAINDEPGVNPPGSGIRQVHAYDFLMCGQQVKEVISWMRVGSSAPSYCMTEQGILKTFQPQQGSTYQPTYQLLRSLDPQDPVDQATEQTVACKFANPNSVAADDKTVAAIQQYVGGCPQR